MHSALNAWISCEIIYQWLRLVYRVFLWPIKPFFIHFFATKFPMPCADERFRYSFPKSFLYYIRGFFFSYLSFRIRFTCLDYIRSTARIQFKTMRLTAILNFPNLVTKINDAWFIWILFTQIYNRDRCVQWKRMNGKCVSIKIDGFSTHQNIF